MKKMLLFLIPSMILSTGCWDRIEINDVAFVAGTGVDKVEDNYLVSIQVTLPGQMGGKGSSGGGGGTSGTGPWYVESAEGSTLREANEVQQSMLSRQLNFSHRRVIVFGEDLAKEGVSQSLDILVRVPQNRLSTLGVVVEGQARDVLNSDAPIENFPAEMIREMAQSVMTENPTLRVLTEKLLKEGIDPILPYLAQTKTHPGPKGQAKTNIQFKGMAVFDQDKLAGVLENEEASILLVAMDQSPLPTIRVVPPHGEGRLEVRFEDVQSRLKPTIKGDKLHIKVEVDTRGSLVENASQYDITKNGNLRDLEGLLRKTIETTMEDVIHKLQHEFHSDPIGIGEAFHQRYPKKWADMREQWKKEYYPRVDVEVVANVHIEHTGSITKPFGFKEGEIAP
ncbi:Ger(x)C family spore germination protein [Ammoniphilus sp. CFH 90114]|uniref:Ger(x)C family spore germination protein n=1 Tax=Ammoniphilus sp. CFH 90114 TaxID=2493665 RepID=UPI00100EDAB1|nr:Ger(x)C family spore germination protein [Ammoniphilus sp. CFH 90114]RXT03997.1 Ger(x)C family spore germination protein [Ammoniphilus sp. CFH 90114]